MNYSDFPDLQVDDFCGTRFGASGQLEVIGWNERDRWGKKIYIVYCHECIKDPELNGTATYSVVKSVLDKHVIPCGCSVKPTWKDWQYGVRVKRTARRKGFAYRGFAEPFHGCTTKLRLSCPVHGEWATTSMNDFLNTNGKRGCPSCGEESAAQHSRVVDRVHLEEMQRLGAYPKGTVFTKNTTRKTSQGCFMYWDVYCPVCGETYTSHGNCLKAGHKGCSCRANTVYGYINTVERSGNVIAIKFGVASNVQKRLNNQNYQAKALTVWTDQVWKYPSVGDCIAAERECKETLVCGIIPKTDMPDGYTETTYIYNTPAIEAIYRKHGGVRI